MGLRIFYNSLVFFKKYQDSINELGNLMECSFALSIMFFTLQEGILFFFFQTKIVAIGTPIVFDISVNPPKEFTISFT